MEATSPTEKQSMKRNCCGAIIHPSHRTTHAVPHIISTEQMKTITSITPTNLELLPFDIFLTVVLPYVGSDHYRFKGSFSANFQKQYCTMFPIPDTMEISMSPLLPGNLNFLQYLDTLDCPWDNFTCQLAAQNGYL
jgi:hypothetical protein